MLRLNIHLLLWALSGLVTTAGCSRHADPVLQPDVEPARAQGPRTWVRDGDAFTRVHWDSIVSLVLPTGGVELQVLRAGKVVQYAASHDAPTVEAIRVHVVSRGNRWLIVKKAKQSMEDPRYVDLEKVDAVFFLSVQDESVGAVVEAAILYADSEKKLELGRVFTDQVREALRRAVSQ